VHKEILFRTLCTCRRKWIGRTVPPFLSGIVGHEVEATVKAIDEALDDYMEEHEDEDIFYSFHEFRIIED
jgi:hypothetical protein